MYEGLAGGVARVYAWAVAGGAAALLVAMAARSLTDGLAGWWRRRADPGRLAARQDEFVRRLVARHRLGRAVASGPPETWYESPRRRAPAMAVEDHPTRAAGGQ